LRARARPVLAAALLGAAGAAAGLKQAPLSAGFKPEVEGNFMRMVQAEIHEHLKDVATGPDENMMRMLFEAEPDPALVFLDAWSNSFENVQNSMVADRLLFQCATQPASCPLAGVKQMGLQGAQDLMTHKGRRLSFFNSGGGGNGHKFPSMNDVASHVQEGVKKGAEMWGKAAKGAVEGSKELVGRVADSIDYKQYWVPAPAVPNSAKAADMPVRFSNPDAFAPDSDGLIAKMKYYIDTFCEDGEIAEPEYDFAMTKEWRGSTFRFVITAPIVRFDKETMTLTVIKPRVLYQKKGGYAVKKGSFNKGAAKEKACAFASGFAYKGKVPQFEGEGTLKEYPDEYTKIFPMTRGGLAAAGQQCDDESKCDTSACPDGTNDCWKQASSASLPDGPLPFIYIDMLDPGTYPSLAVWWQCWLAETCQDNAFSWIQNSPALIGLLGLLGLINVGDEGGGGGGAASPPPPPPNATVVP
jgi:hypothetical protein